MTLFRRSCVICCVFVILLAGGVGAQSQPSGEPQQQDEFIPIDQLPPQDQLPAAPLLIAAYAFVLLALFGYVYSIARRMNTVQREVERLEGDLKRSGRG